MAGEDETTGRNGFGRDTIANRVVTWSGAGILFISIVALLPPIIGMFPGTTVTAGATDQVSNVFNALLPLFGTWMGTVLAYYFTRSNFESAAKTTQTLLGLEERLRQMPVDKYWTPASAMVTVTLPAQAAAPATTVEGMIGLVDLRGRFSKTVTRIPVLTPDKGVKYVIHQSCFYRFGFEQNITDDNGNPLTLADMLAYDDMRQIIGTFASMGPGGTMADAKAKMESVPGAQDVFVTSTGDRNGAVLGWITNTDIAKNSKF